MTTYEQATARGLRYPGVVCRIMDWLRSPSPVSLESILSAAEKGSLYTYLTGHYTIYYDAGWQANLRLCLDLSEEGYLKAQFDEDFKGAPIFISEDARITIAGREYLARLRQMHPKRRILKWVGRALTGWLLGY